MKKRPSRPGTLEPFVPPPGPNQIAAAKPPSYAWPYPYHMDSGGFWLKNKDGEKTEWLSQRFDVPAKARDLTGNAWAIIIQFSDFDGLEKSKAIARADLCGNGEDAIKALLSAGFDLSPKHKGILKNALAEAKPGGRVTLVDQSGWITPGGDYILGSAAIVRPSDNGATGNQYHRTGDALPLSVKGTLEGWREHVSVPCIGNSRLVLAICAAFTGPLLEFFGSDGFGFHIRGDSTTGKSTSLLVGSSVSGCRIGSWRATGNALESICAAANDGWIGLDEMKEAMPHEVAAIIYMLANGVGKARSNRGGDATKIKVWKIVAWSTGEITIAQKIAEGNPRSTSHAGHEVRLVDIEADAGKGLGVFELIPPGVKPETFSENLKDSVKAHSGHALRPFIERVQADQGHRARLLFSEIRKRFSGKWANIDGQANRVLDHFAKVAAAGEFATEIGLTGWPEGEATKAAVACFEVWRRPRTIGNHETRTALDSVRAAIQMHGASRFQKDNEDSEQRMPYVLGHQREIDGVLHYCFLIEPWKREVLIGQDSRAGARHLAKLGYLTTDKDRYTKKIRIRGIHQTTYAVKATILEGDDL